MAHGFYFDTLAGIHADYFGDFMQKETILSQMKQSLRHIFFFFKTLSRINTERICIDRWILCPTLFYDDERLKFKKKKVH